MSIVEMNRVYKRYDQAFVVREFDLRIEDGECLAIVGPSGCGKTSVLRMVAGLEPISAGEILIDGEPVSGVQPGNAHAAMMFQDAALYPHMRVCENIGFPLKMAGESKREIDREVAEIAATLGIGQLLSRRPGQLSGGQRQRVAMARSLIRRPLLLLMDEPMSNLDAKLRGELRATINALRRELRITTLYVTHDHVEAMSLGDRVAVMRDGVIVQLGTPDEVYHDPVDAFVATFIGTPAMNLFLGRVDVSAGLPSVTLGTATVPLDQDRWPDLSDWSGLDLVVGVRPQALRFVDDGAVVDVEHIETVGNRQYSIATLAARSVHVSDDGVVIGPAPTSLTIDTGADERRGEQLWKASHLTVDPDDIHLFDPDTGRSIRVAAGDLDLAQEMRATT